MLAVTGDVIIVALGGILGAIVTAGFAFAGVVVSVRRQKTPQAVEADPELAHLTAELALANLRILELAADRDVWRDLARAWMPRPPAAGG